MNTNRTRFHGVNSTRVVRAVCAYTYIYTSTHADDRPEQKIPLRNDSYGYTQIQYTDILCTVRSITRRTVVSFRRAGIPSGTEPFRLVKKKKI